MSCWNLFCHPSFGKAILAGRCDEPSKDGAFVALGDDPLYPTKPQQQQQQQHDDTNTSSPDSMATAATTTSQEDDYLTVEQMLQQQQYQADVEASANQKIPWVWSRTFHDTYQLGPPLGQGAHAVVHEAMHLTTGELVAIKVIDRSKLNRTQIVSFKAEVQILANLQHPNIIRMHELYKDPRYFFVVLEKLNGGELFDRLCQKQTYSEADARDLCRTILEAIRYCHDHKIVHRDLKPENLLLQHAVGDLEHENPNYAATNHCDTHVKIADFGFAKRVWRPESLTTRCGSPAYTAPEIINYKRYDERVDNWSLGVILFTILGGYPPFFGFTVKETLQQIRQGSYVMLPERWDGISPDAKRLIRGLLTIDMNQRLTCAQALEHPWMTGRGDLLQRKCLTHNLPWLKEFNQERKTNRVLQGLPVKSVSMYWLVSRR